MAISGTFKRNQAFVGARKWGTGVNPVHAIPAEGGTRVRHVTTIAPVPVKEPLPQEITDESPHYGFMEEDQANVLYGYNTQTGTADRPGWGETTEGSRGVIQNDPYPVVPYPSPGSTKSGVPAGTAIRSVAKGNLLVAKAKAIFVKDSSPDMVMKGRGATPLDAGISDPSQLILQTSMAQRDLTRSGSQRGSGSASP